MHYRVGLSDGGEQVFQPVVGTIGSIAGTFAGAAAAPGALVGASLAVPVIGAAIAGITLAVSLFMNRLGPKQKVYTTKIVNDAEPLMKQNLAAWNASNKTRSEQAAALNNFDQVWSAVVAACDRTELGAPGQACVNDRKAGGKWDWFSYYRSPIESDPNVRPDPTVTDEVSSAFSSIGIQGNSIMPWLIGGLLILAVSK